MLIYPASNIMFNIIQQKIKSYLYNTIQISYIATGFRKRRRTRCIIGDICWKIEKAKEYQKVVNICFINYRKASHCINVIIDDQPSSIYGASLWK